MEVTLCEGEFQGVKEDYPFSFSIGAPDLPLGVKKGWIPTHSKKSLNIFELKRTFRQENSIKRTLCLTAIKRTFELKRTFKNHSEIKRTLLLTLRFQNQGVYSGLFHDIWVYSQGYFNGLASIRPFNGIGCSVALAGGQAPYLSHRATLSYHTSIAEHKRFGSIVEGRSVAVGKNSFICAPTREPLSFYKAIDLPDPSQNAPGGIISSFDIILDPILPKNSISRHNVPKANSKVPNETPEKVCVICGTVFIARRKANKGGRGGRATARRPYHSITCSRSCSRSYWRKRKQILKLRGIGARESLL